MANKYVNEFLRMRCCKDIMDIVNPLYHSEKEITESIAIINRLRRETLSNPMQFNILDICAGNALTSLISVYLLPIKYTTAIDKKKKIRDYLRAKNFAYIELDIFDDYVYQHIDNNTIIMSIHPCRELAYRIIDIYNNSPARSLYLMPCCIGKYDIPAKNFLLENLGKYLAWSFYLANKCNGNITIDSNCISPKNAIVSSHKFQ